tara:strand:+ start:2584 stop:2694 length:111 start_codon:yes stop_codon:yes gene_type:complete
MTDFVFVCAGIVFGIVIFDVFKKIKDKNYFKKQKKK